MTSLTDPLELIQGKTLDVVLLWAESDPVFMAIAGATLSPQLELTVVGHGLPDDWPVWVQHVIKPRQMNSNHDDSGVCYCTDDGAPYYVEVVDADTLRIKGVTGAHWQAWDGSGVLKTFPPGDLSGLEGRAQFRRAVDDEDIVIDLRAGGDTEGNGNVLLDVAEAKINLVAPAAFMETVGAHSGVFDVELFDGSGLVTSAVALSPYRVAPEVTR